MSSHLRFVSCTVVLAVAVLLSDVPMRAANPINCTDFFGSGRSSFAYLFGTGGVIRWVAMNNGGPGIFQIDFGITSDFAVPGCYDANSVADVAVWRTTSSPGVFYFRSSASGALGPTVAFGAPSTDIPMGGDLDGDGLRDYTVVRNTGGVYVWYWIASSDSSFHSLTWGASNSMITLPPADYNGDGRDDITVVALNTSFNGPGTYWAADALTGATVMPPRQFGLFDSDIYITGDFLGDSRADFAVWRARQPTDNHVWYILENGGAGTLRAVQFGGTIGGTRDYALRADYSGDGKADIAVKRQGDGTWYWLDSPGFTTFHAQPFGPTGAMFFPIANYGIQ
jgi:hypothetical protein